MLQRIFEWYDCGVGVYIDPDCVAFSAFDEVFSLLSSDASVVLTRI